mgnify:CR=1 FL=1
MDTFNILIIETAVHILLLFKSFKTDLQSKTIENKICVLLLVNHEFWTVFRYLSKTVLLEEIIYNILLHLLLGILLFLIYHTIRLEIGAGDLKLLFVGGLYFKNNELILWLLILLILTVSFKGIHSICNLPWEKGFPAAPLIFFSTIILIFFCIFIPS